MSDTKKAADAAANASLQEEMDAVMRKYDRESATRVWTGKPKIVISGGLLDGCWLQRSGAPAGFGL